MAMADDTTGQLRAERNPVIPSQGLTLVGLALLAALSGGCASITNPIADGIPVNRLPDEVFGRPRAELRDIPLTWLRQPPADPYKLDAGDVLGIYVENVLGDRN